LPHTSCNPGMRRVQYYHFVEQSPDDDWVDVPTPTPTLDAVGGALARVHY